MRPTLCIHLFISAYSHLISSHFVVKYLTFHNFFPIPDLQYASLKCESDNRKHMHSTAMEQLSTTRLKGLQVFLRVGKKINTTYKMINSGNSCNFLQIPVTTGLSLVHCQYHHVIIFKMTKKFDNTYNSCNTIPAFYRRTDQRDFSISHLKFFNMTFCTLVHAQMR